MPESSPTQTRRGRLLRRGASFLVLLAVAGYLAVQYVTGGTGDPACEVVSAGGDGASYEFTPEQAVNAATITAVGTARGLPERAVAIALATALQESGLRNITHGDRDSLGLFQQRPSQGWGTAKEIQDPAYAAGEFYDHLVKVSGYSRLPLTVAAQRVQRSGYPEAYAKHEQDATLLAAALTGHAAATLTCEGRQDATPTGGPDAVRAALVRDFGREVLTAAGATVTLKAPATPAPSPTATSVARRTVTLPVPADTDTAAGTTARQRGWQLAHWAVANASALHIENVSYAGLRWTAGNTDSEWRPIATAKGTAKGTDAVRIVTAQ
ncbi:heavy metal transporter [Streptomyces sp. SID12488]|uniref:heavy metal transporter n=1 Tax=Streptomyces sp. SID12488 TaxID=2706040 RepID=UPI0013D93B8E|nr:heavy metal transporter [Streptomyces sp. SID12488]NEA67808.1 heavy metal transporter [Streptomyces sp. SID12488]